MQQELRDGGCNHNGESRPLGRPIIARRFNRRVGKGDFRPVGTAEMSLAAVGVRFRRVYGRRISRRVPANGVEGYQRSLGDLRDSGIWGDAVQLV